MKALPLILTRSLLSACAPQVMLRPAAPTRQQAQSLRSDWYQRLSPELQRYYAPAQGLQGQALFEALSRIVNQAQLTPRPSVSSSVPGFPSKR